MSIMVVLRMWLHPQFIPKIMVLHYHHRIGLPRPYLFRQLQGSLRPFSTSGTAFICVYIDMHIIEGIVGIWLTLGSNTMLTFISYTIVIIATATPILWGTHWHRCDPNSHRDDFANYWGCSKATGITYQHLWAITTILPIYTTATPRTSSVGPHQF